MGGTTTGSLVQLRICNCRYLPVEPDSGTSTLGLFADEYY